MMYDDFYVAPNNIVNNAINIDQTWLFISAVVAIIGGISIYFLFVTEKDKNMFKGFWASIHEFLNFKKFYIDDILKALYTMLAIFITLSSFSFISSSVATFFLYLVLGHISARFCFELLLMFITLVRTTSEINRKLTKKNENYTNKKKLINDIVETKQENKSDTKNTNI